MLQVLNRDLNLSVKALQLMLEEQATGGFINKIR
ncbi:hypothetical protein T260_13555 [Geobacillus thermopakistaniensis]|uniref:Uncharacterized protein n=1 Tax=Geobacillus thermopakistaniensis (strain MAS1) TaxID=1408282 RepID=A0A7U9J9D2_GEOTM|nr:hypothetical protein GA8_02145 [Geobacillus sp. A8]ESU71417.1 hypothetical protein T260_13555 [Geobacillus sp. MAS1]